VIGLIEAILLLGLAAGPNEPASRPLNVLQDDALADLERRAGPEASAPGKKPQQEDPKPQRPEAPLANPEQPSTPIIDFDWLELHVRAGMAIFSKEFHIDPSPAFVIATRAPMPWLSPSWNPDGDYFGAFAQLEVAVIKRTIEPQVDKPSGAMFGLAVGVDYTILRNTTWMILVKAGVMYVSYGGVTDLNDGIGPMAGLLVGVTVSRSVAITLAPEYIMGKSGDSIISGTVGVAIDF